MPKNLKMIKILLKSSKIAEMQHKPKKRLKYPQNLKISKIPSKSKKWPKDPQNLKNDQNPPET